MSERKVLNVSRIKDETVAVRTFSDAVHAAVCSPVDHMCTNLLTLTQKYYPPDFDPLNIPRLKLAKARQYTVRIMTPCNMKCNTCGDYIAKAKKFNARKETVEGEEYLGLRIYRFYFKCPICMAEITFKTDPKNQDYELEHGATRNFQAYRMAEMQAAKEAEDAEQEEKLNPMKMLENRTKASKREMQALEDLEELKELSQRTVNLNTADFLEREKERRKRYEEMVIQQQKEEDEADLQALLHQQNRDLLTPAAASTARGKKWIKLEGSDEQVEVSDEEEEVGAVAAVAEDPEKKEQSKAELVDVDPVSYVFARDIPAASPPFDPTQVKGKPNNLLKRKLSQLVKVVPKKKTEEQEKPVHAKRSAGSSADTSTTGTKSILPSLGLASLCSYSDSDDEGH